MHTSKGYGKKGDIGGRGCHPKDPTGEIFGKTHWPLPQPHEGGKTVKYMIIETSTPETTRLLKVVSREAAVLYGHIYKAQGVKVIAPPVEGRGFAALEKTALQYLFWHLTQEPPPDDYASLLQLCLTNVSELPVDETSIDVLEKEVVRLCPEVEMPNVAKPPKAPREPGEPIARPKATSTSGQVWEIADRLFVEAGNQIPDRKATMVACEAAGINGSTASTQFGKWKASKQTV